MPPRPSVPITRSMADQPRLAQWATPAASVSIRSPRRDELREHLTWREIETAIYYPLALHEQPCFEYLGYKPGDFPEAERAARESLALPMYPEISREAQQYVVKCAAEFFE